IGLLAKLGRVFLLIPLCFLLMFIMKRKQTKDSNVKIEFPWFLIGFVIMSIIGSYVLGKTIPMSTHIKDLISNLTTWCLTASMVGLGLNVHIRYLRTKALKPLFAMSITSICLSIFVYLML